MVLLMSQFILIEEIIQTWNPASCSWRDTWPRFRETNGTHIAIEFYWNGKPQKGDVIPEVWHAKTRVHNDLVDTIYYSISLDMVRSCE